MADETFVLPHSISHAAEPLASSSSVVAPATPPLVPASLETISVSGSPNGARSVSNQPLTTATTTATSIGTSELSIVGTAVPQARPVNEGVLAMPALADSSIPTSVLAPRTSNDGSVSYDRNGENANDENDVLDFENVLDMLSTAMRNDPLINGNADPHVFDFYSVSSRQSSGTRGNSIFGPNNTSNGANSVVGVVPIVSAVVATPLANPSVSTDAAANVPTAATTTTTAAAAAASAVGTSTAAASPTAVPVRIPAPPPTLNTTSAASTPGAAGAGAAQPRNDFDTLTRMAEQARLRGPPVGISTTRRITDDYTFPSFPIYRTVAPVRPNLAQVVSTGFLGVSIRSWGEILTVVLGILSIVLIVMSIYYAQRRIRLLKEVEFSVSRDLSLISNDVTRRVVASQRKQTTTNYRDRHPLDAKSDRRNTNENGNGNANVNNDGNNDINNRDGNDNDGNGNEPIAANGGPRQQQQGPSGNSRYEFDNIHRENGTKNENPNGITAPPKRDNTNVRGFAQADHAFDESGIRVVFVPSSQLRMSRSHSRRRYSRNYDNLRDTNVDVAPTSIDRTYASPRLQRDTHGGNQDRYQSRDSRSAVPRRTSSGSDRNGIDGSDTRFNGNVDGDSAVNRSHRTNCASEAATTAAATTRQYSEDLVGLNASALDAMHSISQMLY